MVLSAPCHSLATGGRNEAQTIESPQGELAIPPATQSPAKGASAVSSCVMPLALSVLRSSHSSHAAVHHIETENAEKVNMAMAARHNRMFTKSLGGSGSSWGWIFISQPGLFNTNADGSRETTRLALSYLRACDEGCPA